MIYLEQYDILKSKLFLQKQIEILKKIKVPFQEDVNFKHEAERFEGNVERRIKIDNVYIDTDNTLKVSLEGAKEPLRGFTDTPTLNVVTVYKRFAPLILGNMGRMGWFGRICTAVAIIKNADVMGDWFDNLFKTFPVLFKEEYYSQPTRELNRVLKGRFHQGLLNGLLMIVECDTAYRYRFQDVIVEYNRNNEIGSEICRLLDLLASRERIGFEEVADKWIKIKKFVKIAFFFNRKLKKQVKEIMDALNLDELKMSKEDLYWTNQFDTFNYRGKLIGERAEENKKVYGSYS